MAHQIEELQDGTSAFFTARTIAWHKLGVVTEGALTADEALKTAQLDWTVTKQPLQTVVVNESGVTTMPVPNRYATVRDHAVNGLGVLGVVGERYVPVQNSEAFAFCTNIVDEGGAVFETAGALYDGSKVFLTMKLPQDVLIGGVDLVEHYLLITNSHNGTSPLTAAVTPVRAVCQNTVTAAMQSAVSTFKIRHSANATKNIEEARRALELSWKYESAFELNANALVNKSMTKNEFVQFAEALWGGVPEVEGRAQTIATNRMDALTALWDAPTQANVAGTQWAAFNTIVEYLDWAVPVKGADAELRRAERTIEGEAQDVKDTAWRMLISA